MFTLEHCEAHQQHLLDLRKEADRERLIRIATNRVTKQPRMLMNMVGWLGGQLIEWGEFLQRRSASPIPAHLSAPGHFAK